jgi:ATP-dependent helicase HrpB
LPAQSPPEILTADLAPLALELATWGARNADELRWLDAPPAASLAQARELLTTLDALDKDGAVTAMGREMAVTGLHPRLAHMLIRGRRAGQTALAAQLAAILSERDFLRGQRDPDVRTRLELLRSAGASVDRGALVRARDLANRLGGKGGNAQVDSGEAGVVLAWAFPDRIAQLRSAAGAQTRRYLLSNGRGAVLPEISTVSSAAYLVAVELDDAEGAEARIRLAAPLNLAQLEQALASQVITSLETAIDPRTQSLRGRRVTKIGALVLREQRVEVDSAAASAALIGAVRAAGLALLPWGEASSSLRTRMAFAAKAGIAESEQWPAIDEAGLTQSLDRWLAPYVHGVTRLTQLNDGKLREALASMLDYGQQRRLDQLVPTHVLVPTGSRIVVDYEDDNAPCIEVRLQELFGLADTPRIGDGRIPVALKLLSPARRPVQITRDLGGFWRGSYAEVRKELRGRYPRHFWPENPLEAEPTRRARPRGT